MSILNKLFGTNKIEDVSLKGPINKIRALNDAIEIAQAQLAKERAKIEMNTLADLADHIQTMEFDDLLQWGSELKKYMYQATIDIEITQGLYDWARERRSLQDE